MPVPGAGGFRTVGDAGPVDWDALVPRAVPGRWQDAHHYLAASAQLVLEEVILDLAPGQLAPGRPGPVSADLGAARRRGHGGPPSVARCMSPPPAPWRPCESRQRPTPGAPVALGERDIVERPTLAEAVSDAGSVLVSDYGAGMTADPLVRDWMAECAAALSVVWDPHPRGAGPVPGCAAADAVTRRVRTAGGTVAATGGVFEVGVTLLVPGGMATAFLDGRPDQYKPGPDARLADPAHSADAVLFALDRPARVELREIVVAADTEPSWP